MRLWMCWLSEKDECINIVLRDLGAKLLFSTQWTCQILVDIQVCYLLMPDAVILSADGSENG